MRGARGSTRVTHRAVGLALVVVAAWNLSLSSASASLREGVIPFRIHPTRSVILVEVQIAGKDVVMIVDTGATRSIVSPEALGLSPAMFRRSQFQSRGPGFNGKGVWERADLRLGELRWTDHAFVVMEFEVVRKAFGKEVEGLLGQDLLSQFTSVELNFKDRTLRLDP